MSGEVSADELMNDLNTSDDANMGNEGTQQEENKKTQEAEQSAEIDKTEEATHNEEETEKEKQEESQPIEEEEKEKQEETKEESKPEKTQSEPKTAPQKQQEKQQEKQDNVSGKQQGLPSFAPDQQKPLGQLKGRDIFLWRNVYASSVVFAALQALYVLLVVYEMSVLSLVSRLVLFNIAIAVAYYVIRRIFANAPASGSSEGSSNADKFMIDADAVEPYVEQILGILNRGIHEYLSIVKCKDFAKTLKFGGVVWALSILSNLMSGLTLFYLGVWISFTVPRIYEWKKQPIDQILDMAHEHIAHYGKLVYSKIPKASAAKETKTE